MAVPKLQYSIGNAASTTLSVAAANSDTSITLTSDTNFAAKSGAGMVIIDESQATEEIAYSTSKTGAVLSIPLVNRGLEGGTAQGHAINATVKGILTAGMWNDMIDALTNVLNATTGAVDTTKVPVVGGGFATTLTTTASTNVTLPTTGTLATIAGTETLTNKRITKRVGTVTQSATPTINTDNMDIAEITGLAQAITSMTTNLSGTPSKGDKLEVWITDDGTGRAITWGASFESTTVTLPTTTVASTRLRVGFEYSGTKWSCVATA